MEICSRRSGRSFPTCDQFAAVSAAATLASTEIRCLSDFISISFYYHMLSCFLSAQPGRRNSSMKDIPISRSRFELSDSRSSRMWRAICRQLAKRFFRHVPVFHGRVYDRNMLGERNTYLPRILRHLQLRVTYRTPDSQAW